MQIDVQTCRTRHELKAHHGHVALQTAPLRLPAMVLMCMCECESPFGALFWGSCFVFSSGFVRVVCINMNV